MTGSLRIAIVDLNGQLRGKRVSPDTLGKDARMPLSIMNVDIFGSDIDGSPLVFESGDQDGILQSTGRGPIPLPWLGKSAILDPHVMHSDDGAAFALDPRHALQAVLDRYATKGWSVIAACELEFYLIEAAGNLAPPLNPKTGRRLGNTEILSLRELDGFDDFFTDVENGAAAMGIGNLTITAEAGVGQFEVTMTHGDALKIADDVVLLKELIKGTALNHGMSATFMAKPFASESGNGLHTHFSVLGADGNNVFLDTTILESAVAGCLDAFAASTLFFAPFHNSYARFVDGAHAPTSATWGHENRTVAIRIPGGPKSATRIEHRVAGGDVNPYLMFAVIFGAALHGIEAQMTPPPAIAGNAYEGDHPKLLPTWDAAIDALTGLKLAGLLPMDLLENLQRTKRQEHALFGQLSDHDAMLALVDVV